MSQEQASANDKGSAEGFREAQVGASFLLLKYALRGAESLADHFDVDLTGLTENCMEDEMLCTSYEQWAKTRMSTTMFTPGWMLVFTLGSQIMMTRNANIAMREAQQEGFHCPEPTVPGYANVATDDGTGSYFVPLDDGHEETEQQEQQDDEPTSPSQLAVSRSAFQPTYTFSEDPEERARIDRLIIDAMAPSSNPRGRSRNASSLLSVEKPPRKPRARKPSTGRKVQRKKKVAKDHFMDLMAAEDEQSSPDEGNETE